MDNDKVKNEEAATAENDNPNTGQAEAPDTTASPAEGEEPNLEAELDILRTEHEALHNKHLRLYADFDNFRKRTRKELEDAQRVYRNRHIEIDQLYGEAMVKVDQLNNGYWIKRLAIKIKERLL